MGRMKPMARGPWSLADSYDFISTFLNGSVSRRRPSISIPHSVTQVGRLAFTTSHSAPGHRVKPRRPSKQIGLHQERQSRGFHDYFTTHLPSSSLHPDSRSSGPHHKLPRSASTPHTPGSGPSPAAAPPTIGATRELTVVRIPLRSAKHHFGVSVSRGTRPYNEDTFQAGTIEVPAFAKRAPISLSRSTSKNTAGGGTSADGASGDPQVFYFGVFDGHGGNECSDFLREELHKYIESTAETFKLPSSLEKKAKINNSGTSTVGKEGQEDGSGTPISQQIASKIKAIELEKSLVSDWKITVGGYFRRFKPEYFDLLDSMEGEPIRQPISVEASLMYSFLKADLDFISAQARKPNPDDNNTDSPLNEDEILGEPARKFSTHRIGGPTRFIGGSTASVALISTPTPTPFWHPSSPSTLMVAHVGDTRIILCETLTGLGKSVTTNHHPSSPIEGGRLRRYAATFVTDSFGEERMSGLANTRAFGDMRSKRIGVSAEPEIRRVEISPAEYSFLVLVSDGVSGTLTDQEIVDVVKEAKTPEQGARDVVSFATEVSKEGDNATCLIVRLGGWERRIEGGMGSMGTKEVRDYKKGEAMDPRRART
ncbi:protein phosphatase [Sclerotinia borealis F-4128]|uniref:Protein phosphatase n=1 Tax=Sclerotinia borealis (strain F-4128) TaxID=1432307 RepID=W9CHH5_SCLBF|nr:protein phosphatase [Sclerotinia borealis F-4128]